MFPLLLSFLSGIKELSATASLEELQRPELRPGLAAISGIPRRDLIASLCPIAAAFIVATVRYYNEKQVQLRTSDSLIWHPKLPSAFEDPDIPSRSNCGDLGGTPLERRRSGTFYETDNSIVILRVRGSSLS